MAPSSSRSALLALAPVISYGLVALAWLFQHRNESSGYLACLLENVLTVERTGLGYLWGGALALAATVNLAMVPLRKRKGISSSRWLHASLLVIGVGQLANARLEYAELRPDAGILRNGLFATRWAFTPDELQVRYSERTSTGPSLPVLSRPDGGSERLVWPTMPRYAVMSYLGDRWQYSIPEHVEPIEHWNCLHASPD